MSDTARKDAISAAIQARIPSLIWGPPGTGKTSFVEQLAEELGIPVETIIASIREPSDFSGLPVITPSGVKMEAPMWAKNLANAELDNGNISGVLFIDEITTCAPATQAALLRVINDGWVGELKLPSTVARVAAANPPEQAAGGWNLAAPLANRFLHIDWPSNAEAWCDAAMQGWKNSTSSVRVPHDWYKYEDAKLSLVSAYIRTRNEKLLVLPKEEAKRGKAWASPRTWHMLSKTLAVVEATGGQLDDDAQIYLIGGAIGVENAREFLTWMRELDLPEPEELLKDPKKFKLPKSRPDKTYAILSSVATAVLSNLTQARWEAGWKVLAEAASQGNADIAAFAARAFIKAGTENQMNFDKILKVLAPFTEIMRGAGLMLDN